MEAIIDKNMLRAKRWNGNANNIFLSGPGSSKGFKPSYMNYGTVCRLQTITNHLPADGKKPIKSMITFGDVDPECYSVEDNEGNYKLRINAPFMNQCGTQSSIIGDDYQFSNIVKWR